MLLVETWPILSGITERTCKSTELYSKKLILDFGDPAMCLVSPASPCQRTYERLLLSKVKTTWVMIYSWVASISHQFSTDVYVIVIPHLVLSVIHLTTDLVRLRPMVHSDQRLRLIPLKD